jgi:hypothetical protein
MAGDCPAVYRAVRDRGAQHALLTVLACAGGDRDCRCRTGASGGYPGKAPARATFRAERPGHAILMAGDDAACLHSRPPCKIRQRMWRVVVIVAG